MSNDSIEINIDPNKISDKFKAKWKTGIKILKSEIARDTDSFVPFRDGTLRRSVTPSLTKSDDILEYGIVYARFQYGGLVMIGKNSGKVWANKYETKITTNQPLTYSQGGSKWFEKSKDKNLTKWAKRAKVIFK